MLKKIIVAVVLGLILYNSVPVGIKAIQDDVRQFEQLQQD